MAGFGSITIFRKLQFPLRGIADQELLEKALQHIPDHHPYEIVNMRYYPEQCNYCGSGKGHIELTRELNEAFGELVGIGQEPDVYSGKLSSNIGEVFEISISGNNQIQISKNQDTYEPCVRKPERYKWIEDMWNE